MKKIVTLLSGDGIGPEITNEAKKILNKIEQVYSHSFELKEHLIGGIAIEKTGEPLPEETLKACEQSDSVLLACVGDPKYDNDPSLKVRPEQGLLKIRKALGLFSNIRPIQVFDSLITHSPIKENIVKNTDFIIVRELTGGIYFGKKEKNSEGTLASDLCSYAYSEIERITRKAFEICLKRKKRLTLVDKANVLETSRLWRKIVTEIHKNDFPETTLDFMFVDNAAMKIITNPSDFDVILTENMFGDILSDEASVITGSIGLLASSSIGSSNALFEPVHGSYPQAKGKNIANPIAMILCVEMMLNHFGLDKEAKAINQAVRDSLNNHIVTEDLNKHNPKSTDYIGDYIASRIQ